jgi:phage recombination protein Bet
VNGNNKVSTDLVLRTAQEHGFTSTAVELIRNVAAKGRTDEEVAQLLIMAGKTGLDPLARQIYMIGRWDKRAGREIATPQTSIDGYRLIADRTERYAPGRESSYVYDDEGQLVSATAFVKKLVAGTWHEVAATAFWNEYRQTDKAGNPTALWAKMPHVMLAKCAEALALRRAFPAELSGLYTAEEMAQASQDDAIEAVVTVAAPQVDEKELSVAIHTTRSLWKEAVNLGCPIEEPDASTIEEARVGYAYVLKHLRARVTALSLKAGVNPPDAKANASEWISAGYNALDAIKDGEA